MTLVLDILAVAVIILFAVIGYKTGFVKTIIELVGWIVVLFFASILADKLSSVIYDVFISQSIVKAVEKSVADFGNNGINQFFDEMPSILKNLFNAYNINTDSIGVSNVGNDIAVNIAQQIKAPIVSLIGFVLNVIIFVLGIILVRILARVCNSIVSKIPLVSGLNRSLGFVSGLAKGFVITTVICWIFTFIVVFSGGFLGVDYRAICDTQLVNFLNSFNPLTISIICF